MYPEYSREELDVIPCLQNGINPQSTFRLALGSQLGQMQTFLGVVKSKTVLKQMKNRQTQQINKQY